MHGPYEARIKIEGAREPLVASEDDLREATPVAHRFYQDATPALAEGAARCATFYVAALLEAGQDAEIEIVGYDGPGTAKPSVHRTDRVRRDENGRLRSTLGSKFNERVFVGV